MDMVREKCPRVTAGLTFGKKVPAPLIEVTPVGNGGEKRPSLYAPDDDMVENAGGVETGFTGHEGMVATTSKSVKSFIKNLRTSLYAP
jgi:hypothetical protein